MEMNTPSNLYATRIYAEHPVGLWPIDDDLSYLSLIGETHRDVRTWLTSSTVTEYSSFYADNVADPPFIYDKTYKLSGTTDTLVEDPKTYHFIEAISQPLFNLYTETNHEQRVFSFNLYVYHEMPVAFYEIGYLYTNGSEDTSFTERIAAGPPNEWVRIGKTFDHRFEALPAKLFVRVFFTEPTNADFMINGISVGHWSETQSSTSLGLYPSLLPDSSGLNSVFDQDVFGVPLREYGPGTDTAYALIQDKRLLAVNGGIPLVYGSGSVTTLYPSSDVGKKLPSIVVPGKGMFNATGRFNSYTLEAWVRIDNESVQSRRIIGPVSSNDGIYVRGNTIALVIGKNFRTFHVGEWYRPMLVHLILSSNEAALMINGERVLSMPYSQSAAVLPTNSLYNEDWIGFYAWSDVKVFEVDTISIFPYVVPAIVAKRRFVWGHGVESPETINAAYLGTAHSIQFGYANYAVNHSYPETARWDSGQTDNLVANRYALRTPDYELPVIESGSRGTEAVMERSRIHWSQDGGPTFITFTDVGTIAPSYLFFSDSNRIIGTEQAFYASFSGSSEYGAPLFVFVNKVTGEYFRADISGSLITYSFNGAPYQTAVVLSDDIYTVGIDFSKASPELSRFMSNPSLIELYVGGDKTETFLGRIYRVGFCSPENASGIADAFGSDGIIHPLTDVTDFVASYTLLPIMDFGKYYLDIAVSGTWTETFPLGYFASNGDLDIIQFNISSSPSDARMVASFDDVNSRTSSAVVTIAEPDATGVIDLALYPDLTSTGFVMLNNSIIMFPAGFVPERYNLKLDLDVTINGIVTNNFVIRDMSLASAAVSDDIFMNIGTVHGNDMAPYTKVGNYYTETINRPWSIYKGSTPYLYLTNDSGIHPLGVRREEFESGLWITMNKNRDPEFKVSAMQLWMKYSESTVPEEPVELFSVRTDNVWIRFMCQDDGTGLRARIFAVDGHTGNDYTAVKFYQDGKDVIMPFIQNDHWTSIGMDFAPLLDLSRDIGAICLISSCVFNNIVYYRTSSLQEQYAFAYRTWANVSSDGSNDLTWQYWQSQFDGAGATWDQVSKTATITHGISIGEIYRTYTGTNRTVVENDESMLLFDGGQATVISSKIIQESDQYHTKTVARNAPLWTTVSIKPV